MFGYWKLFTGEIVRGNSFSDAVFVFTVGGFFVVYGSDMVCFEIVRGFFNVRNERFRALFFLVELFLRLFRRYFFFVFGMISDVFRSI